MRSADRSVCRTQSKAESWSADEKQRNTVRPGRDIQQRTLLFAVRVLKMVRALPRDIAGQIVARQIGRCGASVGANVEEAQGAQSRADFARKMNIALSEARETLYWLRLTGEAGISPPSRLKEIIQEASELVSILTVIVKRTRQRKVTDDCRN